MADDHSLDLLVAPHPTQKTVGDGDFLAHIEDGILHLPQEVYAWGEEQGLWDTGQEYVCAILHWKEILASHVGWSAEQADAACRKLVGQLEGLLPQSILHPAPPKQYGPFNALPPDEYADLKTPDDYKKKT